METLEAIFTRRSVRFFSDRRIAPGLLKQILQAGAASPSGGNLQAWGFVLAHSPRRLESLRSLAPGIIGQPTAVIAICLDIGRASQLGGAGGEKLAWLDIGIAAQNMLLAAHSLGLGACPIGSFHPAGIAAFLELPADTQAILLLALGYPKTKPASPGRRAASEILFQEKWGQPYEE